MYETGEPIENQILVLYQLFYAENQETPDHFLVLLKFQFVHSRLWNLLVLDSGAIYLQKSLSHRKSRMNRR